jgi:hypothetical protein
MGEHKLVAERKRLNDELDNVRNEVQELKARLSKLEMGKVKPAAASKAKPAPAKKHARKART